MLPNDPFTRRRAIQTGLASLFVPGLCRAGSVVDPLSFNLKERAGIRRFGYPVHTILPGSPAGPRYRLTKEGQDVSAQFRPIALDDGRLAVALDFNASPGPLQTERYVVHSGVDVGAPPEPRNGIRAEIQPTAVRVSNMPDLVYEIPGDLRGFLRGVVNTNREFVREDSEGLMIRHKDDIRYRAGGKGPDGVPTRMRVLRDGPIAVALRFEGLEALGGERSVHSRVDMTFPNSKSWVETTWKVEDPEGYVAGLGVDLRLDLDARPTLVDLGAGSLVYGALRDKERMDLAAGSAPGLDELGRRWVVRKGPSDDLASFAEADGPNSPQAEGWAHIMDVTRCTALAIGGFGRATRDRIIVDADGRVQLWRDFAGQGAAPPKGPKTLTFWFHFVSMPVHVGAATSPQSMLAPLEVEWRGAR